MITKIFYQESVDNESIRVSGIYVKISFTDDPKSSFCYPISQGRFGSGLKDSGMYERIVEKTNNNHELSVSVISRAEIASVGETYETDKLMAEIVEE